jgi:hypothetical protein
MRTGTVVPAESGVLVTNPALTNPTNAMEVAECPAGRANGDDLGVHGRVERWRDLVGAGRDDLVARAR